MTDKNTFSSILFCIVIAGCAHEETKEIEKSYSPTTQKEFEQIEKAEVQRHSIPPAHDLQKQQGKKKQPIVEAPKKEPIELVTESKLSSKGQERLQEINQNLAFYCMKHRNDRVFTNEGHCQQFTKNVLQDCEKKHKLINTVMVNCIKDRLKKRR